MTFKRKPGETFAEAADRLARHQNRTDAVLYVGILAVVVIVAVLVGWLS